MTRADAALIEALERSNIHPLWDRYQRITPMAPRAKDAPMHWRWRELEPSTERAAKEVAIEDVERRALILAHPAFEGIVVASFGEMPSIEFRDGREPSGLRGIIELRRRLQIAHGRAAEVVRDE